MAYMDQDRKAKLAAEVKKVMPAGWKYSLAVRDHSTIVCTISEAPVELVNLLHGGVKMDRQSTEVNPRWFEMHYVDPSAGVPMRAILEALNTGNHDNSDRQNDYYDVGWYVSLKIGRWSKPFVCTKAVAA